jgi:uncharacterized protein YjbI with pentapeptide repeats
MTRSERPAREAIAELAGGSTRTLADIDLSGSVTCTRGIDGISLSGVRGLDVRIGRALLRGRPRIAHATVTDTRIALVKARQTDVDGVELDRVRINGPFEAFEDCTFAGVRSSELVLEGRIRFNRCRFSDCRLDLRALDGIVFVDCRLERVTLLGSGELVAVTSSFRDCDARELECSRASFTVAGAADLRLPARPDCFFVPSRAIDGPLAELAGSSDSAPSRPP